MCDEKQDSGVYDGSKKGTACACWRIKSKMYGLEAQLVQPEPVVKTLRLARREYLGGTLWAEDHNKVLNPRLGLRPTGNFDPYEKCPNCASINVVKQGLRKGRVTVQMLKCRDCGRKFGALRSSQLIDQRPLSQARLQKKKREEFIQSLKPLHLIKYILAHPRQKKAPLDSIDYHLTRHRKISSTTNLAKWLRTLSSKTHTLPIGCKTKLGHCQFCNSTNLVKRGLRYGKSAPIQRYHCKDCGSDTAFGNIRPNWVDARTVKKMIVLKSQGNSYRAIAKMLGERSITAQTVCNYANRYLDFCEAQVS